MIEPTQADREAAARFVIECNAGGLVAGHHEAYRRGEGDRSVLVQILARHAAQARREGMLEAANYLDRIGFPGAAAEVHNLSGED